MTHLSDKYQEHIETLRHYMEKKTSIRFYTNRRMHELTYSDVAAIVQGLVTEIGNAHDFRPFFPKGNPAFSALAKVTAQASWGVEDRNNPVSQSPAAITFFAILVGAVQLMVCSTNEPISMFWSKTHDVPNIGAYADSAAKRCDPFMAEIFEFTPKGEKPKGCIIYLFPILFGIGAAFLFCCFYN